MKGNLENKDQKTRLRESICRRQRATKVNERSPGRRAAAVSRRGQKDDRSTYVQARYGWFEPARGRTGGGPKVEFGVVMMSEYSMGKDTCYTSSEPCSSVRRASCTALWPQSSHPPTPRVDPRPGHSMGCEGPCGLPIGGPPKSRISAPVRSGGANRTAVGVKRPEPPDRVHARRRIDWSGWWALVRDGMCHCRCQCQAVSTLSLGALLRLSIHPPSSISVRQLF